LHFRFIRRKCHVWHFVCAWVLVYPTPFPLNNFAMSWRISIKRGLSVMLLQAAPPLSGSTATIHSSCKLERYSRH
jgi:hypothetical protein